MRLGFDSKRLFCNFTGLGNYSRTTLRNLAERFPEEDYHLYTPKVCKPELAADFGGLGGVTVHTADSAALPALWRSYGVVSDLQRAGIELYHGLSHEIPWGLKQAGIRSVVTIHDLIFRTHPELYPRIDRFIYHLKTGYACRNADRVVAISAATKQQVVEVYGISPEKIDVVYQSCAPLYFGDEVADMADLRQRYGLPERYLLFVGSITRRKNLEVVMEAYTNLDQRYRLPLVVVGRGSKHRAKLEHHPAYPAVKPYLIWIEDLEDNLALKTLYQHADALVYPSLAEGFGLPVVEALLCRTPVITSNRSSLPEAGGPDSLCIDPQNESSVAEAIVKVAENPVLAEQMRARGYAYAISHFGPDATAKAMMNVYRKTLQP